MIIKVHDPAQYIHFASNYNIKKVIKEKAQCILSNKMDNIEKNNISLDQCLSYFEPLEKANIRTRLPVFHASFNPDPDDIISEENMNKMIQDYMTEMGYGEQPYVVFRHEDIDRVHYHIISHRVRENGRKINDSFEKKRSRKCAIRYEQQYHLIPSQEQSGKAKKRELNRHICKEIKMLSDKALEYNIKNPREYIVVMQTLGVRVEDVPYLDKLGNEDYSFLFQKAEKSKGVTPIISAADVGIKIQELKQQFSDNSLKPKNIGAQNKIKGITRTGIQHGTSFSHFERILKKKGIDVIFKINPEDRITGVYFIDHSTKSVFKGSDLGKDFSANAFEAHKERWLTDRSISLNINYDTTRTTGTEASRFTCIAYELTNWYIPDSDFFKELQASKDRRKKNKIKLTLK